MNSPVSVKKSNRSSKRRARNQKAQEASVTWACKVCSQVYSNQQPYCTQCYQSMFYYAYVNQQMFVQPDESYQEMYYPETYPKRKGSCSDDSYNSDEEESNEEVDFKWVNDLIDA